MLINYFIFDVKADVRYDYIKLLFVLSKQRNKLFLIDFFKYSTSEFI